MKQVVRRMVALLLSLSMAVGMISTSAWAASVTDTPEVAAEQEPADEAAAAEEATAEEAPADEATEEETPAEETPAETPTEEEEEPVDTFAQEETTDEAVVAEGYTAGEIRSDIYSAIFRSKDNLVDMSKYNASKGTMDNLTDQVLKANNSTELVSVTYKTDEATGNVTTMEVEMDAELQAVKDELDVITFEDEDGNKNPPTADQTQQILGLYGQYLEFNKENAQYLGLTAPLLITKENGTEFGILGSMLYIAGHTPEEVASGEYTFQDVMGTIQTFYYGNVYGVQYYGNQILTQKTAALNAVKESGAKTEPEKLLVLNDWLAHQTTFDMAYIMNDGDTELMRAEDPQKNEHYQELYDFFSDQFYDQAYEQYYDQAYTNGVDGDNSGVVGDSDQDIPAGNEEAAKAYATKVAEMAGQQGGAAMADAVINMWIGNHIGALCLDQTVCMGYASAYSYLIQWMHPEVYGVNGADTDLSDAANWKTNDELCYVEVKEEETVETSVAKTDENGEPIQKTDENDEPVYTMTVDEEGEQTQEPVYETEEEEVTEETTKKVFSTDAGYITDFVRITFSASTTMYGEKNDDFSSVHFWNAVKVDGEWYYVDPCYTDIYTECMSRDRVETNGDMNHMYFLMSDTMARKMYDGYYTTIDTLYSTENEADIGGKVTGTVTKSETPADSTKYEKTWFSYARSNVYSDGNGKYYYYYDSTDMMEIMDQMNEMEGVGASTNSVQTMGVMDDLGMEESDYMLVYHASADGDDKNAYTPLINFADKENEDDDNTFVSVRDSEGNMVKNDMLTKLYAEYQKYKNTYPSISIGCALNGNKLYFTLSNCLLSYDLETCEVTRIKEYNEVGATRDKTVAFGGMAFSVVDNMDDAEVSVSNPPIASMTIKEDGKMYIDVATTYAFISGKDPHDMSDSDSYGYEFAESNYDPEYNTQVDEGYYSYTGKGKPINDNDEFMWSANFVDTISLSEIENPGDFSEVSIAATCGKNAYTEERDSNGIINPEVERKESEDTALEHHYVKFDEEYYTKDDGGNWNTGTSYVCTICGKSIDKPVEPTDSSKEDVQKEYEEKLAAYNEVAEEANHGHTYTSESAEWAEDNMTATVKDMECSVCASFPATKKLDCLVDDETITVKSDEGIVCTVDEPVVSGKCEDGLTTTYTAVGEYNNRPVTVTKTEQGEPGTHAYQGEWTWIENEDGTYSASVSNVKCEVCGDEPAEAEIGEPEVEKTEDVPADWGVEGKIVYVATATVTKDGNVVGTLTETKKIKVPALGNDLAKCEVTVAEGNYVYNGEAHTPEVTVTYDGETLEKGTDYELEYTDNVNAGTATVKVVPSESTKKYIGEKSATFTIAKASQTLSISDVTKNASTKDQAITLKVKNSASDGGKLSYQSNSKSVKVDSTGKVTIVKNYYGSAKITITAAETDNYKKATKTITVKVNQISSTITAKNFTKTTSSKTQTFSIGAKRTGSGKITYSSSTKYVKVSSSGKVSISKNYVGKAKITIKVAKSGIYKETSKSIYVTVNPAGVKLSSLKNSSGKKMVVKWKRNSQVTGYQIQYSTSKSFKSGNKTVTVKGNKTLSKTISKLTKGKKYYVRVRTYKTVSKTNYYSSWSSSKYVTIKK